MYLFPIFLAFFFSFQSSAANSAVLPFLETIFLRLPFATGVPPYEYSTCCLSCSSLACAADFGTIVVPTPGSPGEDHTRDLTMTTVVDECVLV